MHFIKADLSTNVLLLSMSSQFWVLKDLVLESLEYYQVFCSEQELVFCVLLYQSFCSWTVETCS